MTHTQRRFDMKRSEWFTNFLASFPKGKELQISEKQFNVFVRNSTENREVGYTEYFIGEGFKAYSWDSVAGTRYYVTVS